MTRPKLGTQTNPAYLRVRKKRGGGMKRGMKQTLMLLALAGITAGYGTLAYHNAAMADEAAPPPPTPEPLATIVILADPTPAPERVPRPQTAVYDYGYGADAIEPVARGMYGLDTTQEKLAFAFVVVNRLFCRQTRGDGAYVFARDVAGIVKQAGEFDFCDPDAPITDENRGLAKLGLNVQTTFILTKQYTGYIFPSTLLYMGFANGEAVFYTELGGDAWKVG